MWYTCDPRCVFIIIILILFIHLFIGWVGGCGGSLSRQGTFDFERMLPQKRQWLGSIPELESTSIPIPEWELELQALVFEFELQLTGIEVELKISFQFHLRFCLFFKCFLLLKC